jgi:dTDP-4-amino-4,6-dideoxygalactose transaminase
MKTLASSALDQVPAMLGGPAIRKEPFAEWPVPSPWMLDSLKQVWESGEWGVGAPIIDEFEQRFAEYIGVGYSGSCVNGTEAITVALRAAGVGQGDEVITSPYTFIGTITPIMAMGAIPRFVDIDDSNYLMDVGQLEAAINEHTKAVIPVHIAGCPVDMEKVCAIAKKHNLAVVEDCAQAHGAEWKGKKVGAWGHAGTFSFQTSKNMSSGEGGAVTTDDAKLADGIFAAKNCGRVRGGVWYGHEKFGSNLRLSAWQAALLIGQIDTLDAENAHRHESALYLESLLAEVDGIEALAINPREVTCHAHHLVLFHYNPERFEGLTRDQFTTACQAEGIPLGNGYVPIYQQGSVREFADWPYIKPILASRGIDYAKVKYPVAERISEREGMWVHMNVLMGAKEELDSFAEAFLKIQRHAGELVKKLR